jgi:hypothetical protein
MTVYTYNITDFPNDKVNSDRLNQEIHSSSITISLDHIDTNPDLILIHFKTDLSISEKQTLDNIIANHSGEPLPDSGNIQQVKVITEQPKYIIAGNTTQEFFSAESIIIDISTGEILKIVDISWPFDISLKTGTLNISEDMIGDEISVEAAPNTLIGALTSSLKVGDTSANVSPTVIQNIKRGYYFNIYSSNHEIGRVTMVDGDYITFSPPSDVSANPGTYVSMTPKIIPYAYLNSSRVLEIGKTIATGNRVPKNTIVRVKYKNNNGVAKKIGWFIEYLY